MAVLLTISKLRALLGKLAADAAVTIASSTNASPTVVTTSANHGYSTGDAVAIYNHATNTAANGLRTVTVLSPTTFSAIDLNTGAAVNGNGVGGATGSVQRVAVGWQPEDLGDMGRVLQSMSIRRGSDANRTASSTLKTILGL